LPVPSAVGFADHWQLAKFAQEEGFSQTRKLDRKKYKEKKTWHATKMQYVVYAVARV
jgi:hypothetical protein